MNFTTKKIAEICHAEVYGCEDIKISYLLTDSRSLIHPLQSLFFAINGIQHDGNKFIVDLYNAGVRAFVVSSLPENKTDDVAYILVNDVVEALQKIASYHRKQFDIPCLGITGSNGKTIVKEWLSQVILNKNKLTRSPKSYNSQIGVPLSVSLLNVDTEIAIFEAGISQVGEMNKLEKIIQPNIGLFTNLGNAHQENFESLTQKLSEKLLLFKNCDVVILPVNNPLIKKTWDSLFPNWKGKCITWSFEEENGDYCCKYETVGDETEVSVSNVNNFEKFTIPYVDEASVQNSITCFFALKVLKFESNFIVEEFRTLERVAMRLEVKEGINDCVIVNDFYNSDVNSLRIALDFAVKQEKEVVLIISDILQSGISDAELYEQIADIINNNSGIVTVIGVGENISKNRKYFKQQDRFFTDTHSFIDSHIWSDFHGKTLLLKAARIFKFEQLSKLLELKTHQTVLEVRMDAMFKNLRYFRQQLKPETKLMVMVKAFSYGTGYVEIARFLQYHGVDYLGVAFADEGVDLRKAGIHTPIIVMNPLPQSFELLVDYGLEPEVYSIDQLKKLRGFLKRYAQQSLSVHLKLDTGMHRLGFIESEIDECICLFNETPELKLQSVFSHFAASDLPYEDKFTKKQLDTYNRMYEKIKKGIGFSPIRHIANTNGILRHSDSQLDMVRLGIGLYGLGTNKKKFLETVSVFKTRVISIKKLSARETVGYNRSGVLKMDSTIAVIPVGYADGLNRKLGNGAWKMNISGKLVPTIGEICMDMCMLDVSGLNVSCGDEVIIFGDVPKIEDMAKVLGTIVYEVLTGIPQRVKRIYSENS